MRAVAVVTFATILALAGNASAKSLRNATGPAETPPLSYSAALYVDSKGCAYIRSGYGGVVTWVPRVQRNRQVVCGLKPTVVSGASRPTASTAKPRTASAQSARPAAAAPRKPKRQGMTLFGTPRRVSAGSSPSPSPAPTVFSSRPKTTAKPVKPVKVAAVTPRRPTVSPSPAPTVFKSKPAAAPKPVKVAAWTFGVRRHGTPTIRRGPQAVHPADAVRRARGQEVAAPVQVARAEAALPEGYKSLLGATDPTASRGIGTPEGRAAMDLIWTQTMPRRLIDVTTGRDMTAALPQIRYPYTGTVSTRQYAASAAKPAKKLIPVGDEASPANMKQIEDVSALTSEPIAAVISARVASHRFVQVATFGVPANARRTLARFGAVGLPTYARPYQRGGAKYEIVLLGPFQDQAGLQAALSAAQQAGFSDAFYVN